MSDSDDALAAAPPAPPAGAPCLSTVGSLRDLAAAFGLGLVGVVALTIRVWAHPTRRVVGDWRVPDFLSYHWVYGQVADRLARGESVVHLTTDFAPGGESPLRALGGAAPVLAAPLLLALGWPLGLNVYLALVCAANVAGGAAFARALGATWGASLVGGLGFGLSPFFLTEASAGRLGQLPAWELAGCLALWLTVLERPGRGRAVGAAVLFGLTTFEYAWYGLLAAISAVILLIFALWTDPSKLRDRAWRTCVGLAVLLGGVSAVPGVYALNAGLPTGGGAAVPAPLAVLHSLSPGWPLGWQGGAEIPAAVSWLLVALAVLGAASAAAGGRRVRGAAVVALVAWALSLGPRMLWGGEPVLDSHLPFYAFYSTLFPRFLFPYQHLVLVSLLVSGLAARAVGGLAARLPRWGEALMVGLVVVAVPAELHLRGVRLAPAVSHLAPEPSWIPELRALPEGALLSLPLAPELRVSQEGLLLQMLHRHPIVDGRTAWLDSQRPLAWDAWVSSSSMLAEIVRFERGIEDLADATRANYFRYDPASVPALRAQGVRWLMVWDPLYGEPIRGLARAEHTLLAQLFGEPVVQAEGLSVFDLSRPVGTGDQLAPLWRMPESVVPGDGTRRMSGRLPPGMLFEPTP